jgi:hypothetical protein
MFFRFCERFGPPMSVLPNSTWVVGKEKKGSTWFSEQLKLLIAQDFGSARQLPANHFLLSANFIETTRHIGIPNTVDSLPRD